MMQNENMHPIRDYYKTCTQYREGLAAHTEDYFKAYVTWVRRHVKEGRILDMGCGNGLSSRLLAQQGFSVTGVDLSFLFLKDAFEARSAKLNYVIGDAMALPFENESFEAICSMSLVEHIPDVQKALIEMVRVVKGGGVILIMAPNLVSPVLAAKTLFNIIVKKRGMPSFASTPREAGQWLAKNIAISLRKKFFRDGTFLYRRPDLERVHTGDTDSVYLACQMDLKYFFENNHMEIIEYAYNDGIQPLGKILARLIPDFSGACSIVARKPLSNPMTNQP